MTTFLNFNVFAAARGEGLRPELRLLYERAATSSVSDVVIRPDGLLQSGPDPASETVPERVNVSLFSANPSPADGRAEPESRNTGPTSCCLGEVTP
jgi:hypothetical protein